MPTTLFMVQCTFRPWKTSLRTPSKSNSSSKTSALTLTRTKITRMLRWKGQAGNKARWLPSSLTRSAQLESQLFLSLLRCQRPCLSQCTLQRKPQACASNLTTFWRRSWCLSMLSFLTMHGESPSYETGSVWWSRRSGPLLMIHSSIFTCHCKRRTVAMWRLRWARTSSLLVRWSTFQPKLTIPKARKVARSFSLIGQSSSFTKVGQSSHSFVCTEGSASSSVGLANEKKKYCSSSWPPGEQKPPMLAFTVSTQPCTRS